jgi:hypothetical protein
VRKQRGQLTHEKIQQCQQHAPVVAAAHRRMSILDIVEGLFVIYGCCCRGRDIATLTAARVSNLAGATLILWAMGERRSSQLSSNADDTHPTLAARRMRPRFFAAATPSLWRAQTLSYFPFG